MLEIKGFSIKYGDFIAVQEVSLEVRRGEILALVGPNGAGKSTLIRAISGVQPLFKGSVYFEGRDLNGLSSPERASLLAVVPQARTLPENFTVYHTVLLGRTPYLGWMGQPKENDYEQVETALEQTHTKQLENRIVGSLSGGEQQRVLLARALAQDTPVLLLDEPTVHLDLSHQSTFLNLVRSLVQQNQLAVLLILHDMNQAGLYADRVAILVDGRLHSVGDPGEVLTGENLSEIYEVPVQVIAHPEYGTPLILPDGLFAQNQFDH